MIALLGSADADYGPAKNFPRVRWCRFLVYTRDTRGKRRARMDVDLTMITCERRRHHRHHTQSTQHATGDIIALSPQPRTLDHWKHSTRITVLGISACTHEIFAEHFLGQPSQLSMKEAFTTRYLFTISIGCALCYLFSLFHSYNISGSLLCALSNHRRWGFWFFSFSLAAFFKLVALFVFYLMEK